jgi:hypothetical protein
LLHWNVSIPAFVDDVLQQLRGVFRSVAPELTCAAQKLSATSSSSSTACLLQHPTLIRPLAKSEHPGLEDIAAEETLAIVAT